MRLLLDTHALLWWLAGDEQLPLKVRKALADRRHEIVVSAASACEVTTKHRLGKLPMAGPLAVDFGREVRLALVSNEAVFDEYGVSRYW